MPSDFVTVITNADIENLRKEGKYAEAYVKAQEARRATPDATWVYRQLGWCIYYLLKDCANATQSRDFMARLQELADIDKERELDPYITKTLVWPVRQFVVSCIDGENVQEPLLYQVHSILRQIKFDPTDENYSILLGAFIKAKKWSGLKDFIEWWGLDNIKAKDCEPYVTNEGRSIMSVAEQTYIAYSNILLHELQMKTADRAQVADYVARLAKVIEVHPEFQYPSYFRARLLLESDRPYEARETLLPFIKRKSNDYWVWELYGDASSDDDIRLACYCKALSCHVKEQFLRKLHFKVCDILLHHEQCDEAATELYAAVTISEKNGWTIPYKFQCYTTEQWYLDAQPHKDNHKLYNEKKPLAEEIIYSDRPQMAILVTYVNAEKKMANFVTGDHKQGFFSYKGHVVELGKTYLCRMTNDNGQYYILHTLKPTDGRQHGLLKDFAGTLNINPRGCGVVSGVFVPPQLMGNFRDGTAVYGTAAVSYNPKKNSWGWRAIEIEQQTNDDGKEE